MQLMMKNPDHHPDDAFTVEEVYKAASFVLHEPTDIKEFNTTVTPAKPTPTTAPGPSLKIEDFQVLVQMMAMAFNAQNQSRTTAGPSIQTNATATLRELICFFCGGIRHFGRDCKDVQAYIDVGKIKRNPEGKIVLSGGSFCPKNIPGDTTVARLTTYSYQMNVPNNRFKSPIHSNVSMTFDPLAILSKELGPFLRRSRTLRRTRTCSYHPSIFLIITDMCFIIV
jgi:hypothetical protein